MRNACTHAHYIHIIQSLIHILYTYYTHIIHILYTSYTHIMHILYTYDYTYYTHTIHILYTYYIHIIYILYTHCIHNIYIHIHICMHTCIQTYMTHMPPLPPLAFLWEAQVILWQIGTPMMICKWCSKQQGKHPQSQVLLLLVRLLLTLVGV